MRTVVDEESRRCGRLGAANHDGNVAMSGFRTASDHLMRTREVSAETINSPTIFLGFGRYADDRRRGIAMLPVIGAASHDSDVAMSGVRTASGCAMRSLDLPADTTPRRVGADPRREVPRRGPRARGDPDRTCARRSAAFAIARAGDRRGEGASAGSRADTTRALHDELRRHRRGRAVDPGEIVSRITTRICAISIRIRARGSRRRRTTRPDRRLEQRCRAGSAATAARVVGGDADRARSSRRPGTCTRPRSRT